MEKIVKTAIDRYTGHTNFYLVIGAKSYVLRNFHEMDVNAEPSLQIKLNGNSYDLDLNNPIDKALAGLIADLCVVFPAGAEVEGQVPALTLP